MVIKNPNEELNKRISLSAQFERASEQIIVKAQQLIEALIEARGHDDPPFLSEEYAHMKGVKEISLVDLGKTDAMLVHVNDGYIIKLNRKHSASRQSFSCAHEVGHILLSELEHSSEIEKVEFRSLDITTREKTRIKFAQNQERLCNIAATELLMPTKIFGAYIQLFGVSIHTIEHLADIFKVSIQSCAIRIAELSVEPCISVFWKHSAKYPSKALRFGWSAGPGRTIKRGSAFVPTTKIAEENSVPYKAYVGLETIVSSQIFKNGSKSLRCRMESKGFGYDDRRFVISLAFPN